MALLSSALRARTVTRSGAPECSTSSIRKVPLWMGPRAWSLSQRWPPLWPATRPGSILDRHGHACRSLLPLSRTWRTCFDFVKRTYPAICARLFCGIPVFSEVTILSFQHFCFFLNFVFVPARAEFESESISLAPFFALRLHFPAGLAVAVYTSQPVASSIYPIHRSLQNWRFLQLFRLN